MKYINRHNTLCGVLAVALYGIVHFLIVLIAHL